MLELAFAILLAILGVICFAVLLSGFVSSLGKVQEFRRKRINEDAALRKYLISKKVSTEVGAQILRYAAKQRDMEPEVQRSDLAVFSSLSTRLRMALLRDVYMPIITAHPMFRKCVQLDQSKLLWQLCDSAISERYILAERDVYSKGREITHMYFVVSGMLRYSSSTLDENVTTWVCEIALWCHWKATGDVDALKNCELAMLSVPEFQQICTGLPFFREYATCFAEWALNTVEKGARVTDLCCDADEFHHMAHRAYTIMGGSLSSNSTTGSISTLLSLRRLFRMVTSSAPLENQQGEQTHIIFSHASRVRSRVATPQVEQMIQVFNENGIPSSAIIYQHSMNIPPGQHWADIWMRSMQQAVVVIIMMEEEYLKSQACVNEFLASENKQQAIVICNSDEMSALQAFNPGHGSTGCGKVVMTLSTGRQLYLNGPQQAAHDIYNRFLNK